MHTSAPLGTQVIDELAFGGITIPKQELGAALLSDGFAGVDGIIGWVCNAELKLR